MASLFSTCAQFAPASCASPPAKGTPHVRDPINTARTRVSDDSSRRPSGCAPTAFQSPHHDPKYNPLVSSDVSRVSTSQARVLPAPKCLYAAVAQRIRLRPTPALPSSRQQSTDRRSSRSYRHPTRIPSHVLLPPKSLPSPAQSFQTRASRKEMDPHRQRPSESNPSCAATSPSCRHPPE